jgi:hypothetical protein
VSISQFTNILKFRIKDVRCQPVHLRKAASIVQVFYREHPRKMFVGYTLTMFEILQAMNVAKTGRASFGRNDNNNLPRLHCERRRISEPKLPGLEKNMCIRTRQVS